YGAEGPARARTAAEIVDKFAQGEAEGDFHQAGVLHVARKLHDAGAPGASHAEAGVGVRPVRKDHGNGGQRDGVVDDRGLSEQALDGRERWARPDDALLAFEAFKKGGLLAADVGSGTESQLDVECFSGAQDRIAEVAGL